VKIKLYLLNIITEFTLAWQLLTIIPLPVSPKEISNAPGRSTGYYPLVGLILGGLLAGAGQLLFAFLPAGLASVLLLVLWAGLTGLLHLDGFMDSCDGLLPPRDPARRLEIMKDSHVGAFGVVGVILLLLLKFNALVAVPAVDRVSALVVVPVLARWAMTWIMARYPAARREGLGVYFGKDVGWGQAGGATVIAAGVSFLFMGWVAALLLFGLVWLTATLMARLALARIGGLTGDVYGAICEVGEAVGLISVVLLS
jgi:adenosylcobinamide-GDP ribazoletransferase